MTKIDAIRKAVDDTQSAPENKHKPIVELYQIFVQKLSDNGYEIIEKRRKNENWNRTKTNCKAV